MTGLTDRQAEIYAFIIAHQKLTGVPPSLREIGAHFAIKSTNGVVDHVKALVRKGHVVLPAHPIGTRGMSRSLRIVGDPCTRCGGLGVHPAPRAPAAHVSAPAIPDLVVPSQRAAAIARFRGAAHRRLSGRAAS